MLQRCSEQNKTKNRGRVIERNVLLGVKQREIERETKQMYLTACISERRRIPAK